MPPLTIDNLAAIGAQSVWLVIICTLLVSALRIDAPSLNYLLWRLVAAAIVLTPWLQTPQAGETALDETIVADVGQPARMLAMGVQPPEPTLDWTSLAVTLIGLGVVLRLLWLAAGLWRLRRLRREGEEMPHRQHEEMQRQLGTRAEVRFVEALRQPATFGVWRPVVLLPERLRDDEDARRAVLTHELLHVARRDWAWQLFEEIVRAVGWFHPALWWSITRIQMAREEVVDARAVATIGNRQMYLRALVEFADDAAVAGAPGFARRRHLFRRIVLLSQEDVMSSRRILLTTVLVCAVLVFGAKASMVVFPTQSAGDVVQSQPGPAERSARLTSPENPVPTVIHLERAVRPPGAEADDAEVGVTLRTVIDEGGNVVEVRLASFAFRRDGDMAAMFGGPDAVATFPFPVVQEFIAAAADAVRRTRYDAPTAGPAVFTTMTHFGRDDTLGSVRTVAMVQRVPAEGAIKVGGQVKVPVKVKDVRAVYPPAARAAGIQGVVILEVRIEGDGRVSSAGVLRSIPELDQAALDAVYQWEFQPTLLNGAPVPVILTVTVQFTAR
jgi:protein TonB